MVVGLRQGGVELGRISPRVPGPVLRELAAVRRDDRRRPDQGARGAPRIGSRPVRTPVGIALVVLVATAAA